MSKTETLIPPDLYRCQAERRVGAWPTAALFMSLGPPELVRCKNRPIWIATEKEADADGLRGSMSLCDTCRGVMEKQIPGHATFAAIRWPQGTGGPNEDDLGHGRLGGRDGVRRKRRRGVRA